MKLVDVFIEDPFLFNGVLTYECSKAIAPGCRVLVPVNATQRIGFVKRSYEGEVDFELKHVLEIIDDTPIVNEELMELGYWMAKTTLNPIIRCFQAILPNVLRPTKSYQDKQTQTMVRVIDAKASLTDKQSVFVSFIGETRAYSEARKVSPSMLKTLLDKGVLERFEITKEYVKQDINALKSDIVLNDEQQAVLAEIDLNKYKTTLLHGVTGSGKTEIYLQCAKTVINKGKQVLVLVPEISLTPQMIDRFQKRFGQDIGVYHSGLSNQEKYEQYLRVQKNEVSIVVGTRSAVFMPFKELGLIVMDEEHDDSFKQDSTPYYHAREIAHFRCQYHQCPLILGSASPSLDSYAKAVKGHYQLLKLKHRVNLNLPTIHLINTQKQLKQLKYQPLANDLIQALKRTLEQGNQSILLLNRRSYSPILRCFECGHVLVCPHCDTALSYHKDDNHMHCHTCDHRELRSACPQCHNTKLDMVGLGTQKLEEIVQNLFPQARILRMDRDTTTRKNAHFNMLKAFSDGEYDILIGTQMIAKGLDIPKVVCVGILNIDTSLMHEDFSSSERVFSLMLQASGRAGRHNHPGEVYIQTGFVDHYAIDKALKQDYVRFFKEEMHYRHQGMYPPYSYLIELTFSHLNEERCFDVALDYHQQLYEQDLFVALGPTKLRKIKDLNRYRIILKGKNLDRMREVVYNIHESSFKQLKGVRLVINVNPTQLWS